MDVVEGNNERHARNKQGHSWLASFKKHPGHRMTNIFILMKIFCGTCRNSRKKKASGVISHWMTWSRSSCRAGLIYNSL